MSTSRRSMTGQAILLLAIAFIGIFVYGLLTALPGTVLPELERNRYLPNDATAGTFLLINAIGAVVSYCVSGPLTDRLGKRFTLLAGAGLVIISMAGFALTVTTMQAGAALGLIFGCSLVLGLGANAIVSAGHALVADVADAQRNAALNLLDVCFGLGLSVLPLVAGTLGAGSGLGSIFWILGGAAAILLVLVLLPRFPRPSHPESFPISEARDLFRDTSFWLLAIALFMYVGAEVSVGKWVVTFLERDADLLKAAGLNASVLQEMSRTSPDAFVAFFKNDAAGVAVGTFALRTLSLFGFSLMIGRLISSFLLGVMRINTYVLLTCGSALTVIGLAVTLTASLPETVRWSVVFGGIGMGPIFPTSVGLASAIVPRIAGTAMSWVMGIGFAGLLAIPPAVGYLSTALGGPEGDVRKGLYAVLAAAILMLAFHIILSIRERRRAVVRTEVEVVN
jgi:fucose permease